MRRIGGRVPEGGAIQDERACRRRTTSRMYSRLKGEYERFAEDTLKEVDPPKAPRFWRSARARVGGNLLLERRPDMSLVGLDAYVDMVRAASPTPWPIGVGTRRPTASVRRRRWRGFRTKAWT
jgi:hypothetical protein